MVHLNATGYCNSTLPLWVNIIDSSTRVDLMEFCTTVLSALSSWLRCSYALVRDCVVSASEWKREAPFSSLLPSRGPCEGRISSTWYKPVWTFRYLTLMAKCSHVFLFHLTRVLLPVVFRAPWESLSWVHFLFVAFWTTCSAEFPKAEVCHQCGNLNIFKTMHKSAASNTAASTPPFFDLNWNKGRSCAWSEYLFFFFFFSIFSQPAPCTVTE